MTNRLKLTISYTPRPLRDIQAIKPREVMKRILDRGYEYLTLLNLRSKNVLMVLVYVLKMMLIL
jgi:hypothetical protein